MFRPCPSNASFHRLAVAVRAIAISRSRGVDERFRLLLRESKPDVFADNPAVRRYLRMGYRMVEPLLAQPGVMRTMTRGI
jgi:hypothetical protein